MARTRDEIQDFSRGRCMGVPFGDGTALCRVLGLFPLFVLLKDRCISPRLMADGFWETWVTIAVCRIVQRGWRVIDVGANVGYYSVVLSELVGPEGRVEAVEPNEEVLPLLRANVNLNGYGDRCAIHPVAVADAEGEAVLTCQPTNLGSGTLGGGAGGQTQPVVVRTLDSLFAGRLDFVKVDAEGFDYRVWRGSRRLRRENPALTFLVEHYPCLLGGPQGARAALEEVVAAGYSVESVEPSGGLREVSPCEVAAESSRMWNLVLRNRPAGGIEPV
jgi:FkbM family methyltransferase